MPTSKGRPASWTRHMTAVRIKRGGANKPSKGSRGASASGTNKNFASYLPAVYTGVPNRVDRYQQYDQMDQDPEISTGLDILTEFCTQNSDDFGGAFQIHYKDNQMGDTEVTTLENRLDAWNDLNDFNTRIFDIFRNVLKNGDQFFVRDPETFELHWVEPSHVEKITMNESKGKEPAVYFIKDLALNLQHKVVSNQSNQRDSAAYPGAMPHSLSGVGQQYGSVGGGGMGGGSDSSPFPGSAGQQVLPVDAKHVVHLSLNTGMDLFFPFGTSVLEKIFKTYKQKELLEDSIIIYRVQRAPERRVFKIDTGDMPEHMAMQHVERIKNEIHQRRIPTNRGGSTSLMDAAYNPLSILEDFFFPQTADGRGSSVETLPGGDNLGQIDDLRWFNNKLIRGLKIPQSYLPFGPEDGTHTVNDGHMGQALIQEFRFNKYCQRLQATLIKKFDDEFKAYLEESGYNFNYKSFEVTFLPPMNFAAYRKAELESTLIAAYSGLNDLPFIAKQTILNKMGWKQDEIVENERLWLQENPDKANGAVGGSEDAGLGSVGIENPAEMAPAEGEPMEDDGMGEDPMGGSPISGAENSGDQTF